MDIYVDYDKFVTQIYNPCVQALKEMTLDSDTSFGIYGITTDVEASIIETYCELYKAVYYTVSSMLADYAEARIYIHNFSLVDRYISCTVDDCTAARTAAASAFANMTGFDHDSNAVNASLDDSIPTTLVTDTNLPQKIIVNSYMIKNLISNMHDRLKTFCVSIGNYENYLKVFRDAPYLVSVCCSSIQRNITDNHSFLLKLLKSLLDQFERTYKDYWLAYSEELTISSDDFVLNKGDLERAIDRLSDIETLYSGSVIAYNNIQFEANNLPAFNFAQENVFRQVQRVPNRTELVQNLADIRTKIDSYITTIDEVEETYKGRLDSELADDITLLCDRAISMLNSSSRFTVDSSVINGLNVESVVGGDLYSITGGEINTDFENGVERIREYLENQGYTAEEIEICINELRIMYPDDIAEIGKVNTNIDISELINDCERSLVINRAIDWALGIAYDSAHGYSQSERWGPEYDCSSFVISAFENAGLNFYATDSNGELLLDSSGNPIRDATFTGNMVSGFTKHGFVEVEPYPTSLDELIPGDVIMFHYYIDEDNCNGHTMLYLGNGSFVHSSRNADGVAGDEHDTDIFETSPDDGANHHWNYGDGYWRNNFPYDCFHVLRYVG